MQPSPLPAPIEPTFHEKIWGRPRDGVRLGEIWFRAHPLLLKFIFTTEKLSVQVHPSDAYALQHENSSGKTECWYILDAEPGARLAVGLRRPMSRAEIAASVESQTIEHELNWLDIDSGDFIFVPSGTVHAIGPGLTLCEVQQFSDVTYRLYDYGRPRELHLEKALDVIRHHAAAGRMAPAPAAAGEGLFHDYLVACRYFALERFRASRECRGQVDVERPQVLAFLEGEGEIVCGGHRRAYGHEQMWRVPEGAGGYEIVPRSETVWLRARVPAGAGEVEEEMARAGVSAELRRRIVIRDV